MMRALALLALPVLLAACPATPPPEPPPAPLPFVVPDALRTCPGAPLGPRRPPPVRTVDHIADYIHALELVWRQSEAARAECAKKLASVVDLTDRRAGR